MPRIYKLYEEEKQALPAQSRKLELDMKELVQKHNAVMQSARQIFNIVVNCVQELQKLKDKDIKEDQILELIEKYKAQLTKYDKVLKSEGIDRNELQCENLILEHKKRLILEKRKKNTEGIIEVLLSLRVNILQIIPELKKNLVTEIIDNDFFLITIKGDKFLLDLLEINSKSLKNALYAMISVTVSIYKGVQYIVSNGNVIFQRMIDVN